MFPISQSCFDKGQFLWMDIEGIKICSIQISIKFAVVLVAGVVELVDTLVSGTSAARLGSSSLPTCTLRKNLRSPGGFLCTEKLLMVGRREVYPGSEAIREVSPPVQIKPVIT